MISPKHNVISLLIIFISAFCAARLEAAANGKRPNIVLIMVDDMGFSDLGCYGGEIDTPNLDGLARNGLRYTHCYNTSRCCPSRASLLTGQYPHKTGQGFMAGQDAGKPGYRGDVNHQCVTIAEVLGSQGYATYIAGKWHICGDFTPKGPMHNWPRQRGFDRFFGSLIGVGSYWDPLWLFEENEPIKPEGDFYYTEQITKKTIQYITENPSGKPFFCYVAYTAPHFPLHAREEVIEKYRGRFAAGWDRLRETRQKRLVELGVIDPATSLSPRDPKVPKWEDAENRQWQQSRMEAYAAAIDHVDQGVGDIVNALKKTGQWDNTIILFLSDNGGESMEHPDGTIASTGEPWAVVRYVPLYTRDGRPVIAGDIPGIRPGPDTTYAGCGAPWANLSNTPFRKFKTYVHEGGISTPLIVHWPNGIRARGELRRQVAHVIDIMPTFIDLADAEYPETFHGKKIFPPVGTSLTGTFDNQELPPRTLFWEHKGNRAVRDGRWKLVAANGQPWELYDIEKDRTETRDLAADNPEIVSRLTMLYDDWARETGVIPFDELGIPFIPPEDNPLIRSASEIEKYLGELEARGIEAPFVRHWRAKHPRDSKQ